MSDEYYTLDFISDSEPFVEKDGHRMFMVDVVKDLNYWKRKKEKLQAENEQLKKQSQWISVKDELPELNKTVMIDSCSGFDFARFNGDYWTRKAWPLGYTPKYWMPLPKPPEGE